MQKRPNLLKISIYFSKKNKKTRKKSCFYQKNTIFATIITPNFYITMKKEDREFLKKVEKLVYEQMKQKHVNCDTVCESLGMTNQSLRRKILAITGQTGGKYLLTIRMKYAKDLLAKGRYAIGQVAMKCGYDDANNFSRTFKREIGMKPSEYAESRKK